MPVIPIEQTSFVGGEVSPLVFARNDIALWGTGAEKLLNLTPLSQGPARTRPGLRHVAFLPSANVRLEDFVFAEDQRYVLCFDAGTFTAWTADGVPCNTITDAPWTLDMLRSMSIALSGDTILVLHTEMQPRRLRRTGALTFALDLMPVEVPAFARHADVAIALAVDAVGATGSTATMTASAAYFTPEMAGRQLRFRGHRVRITAVADPTTASVTWQTDSTGTDISATPSEWFEEAWSDALGWPGSGTFYHNRLVLAGSRSYPGGVWISRTGAYFSWDVGTSLDDEAIVSGVEPTGKRVPHIRHAVAADRLLFLTDAGIWTARASAENPLTPKTFALSKVSGDGTGHARPVMFDNAVMWIDQTGRVTRELLWSDSTDGYASSPTSLPSEHLIRRPHQIAAYEGAFDRPEALALLANEDGTLAVFHSVRSEKLAAWVPWTTDGFIRSVAAVGEDVFVAVTRAIGFATTTRLERFAPNAEALDAAAPATLPAPGRTFTGFAHLAGHTVALVSRGHYLGEATVSAGGPEAPEAGTITLPETALDVDLLEAGLPFEQRLRPLPAALQMQGSTGSARTAMKRIVRAIVQVDRSGSFRIAGRDVLLAFVGDQVGIEAPTKTGQIVFSMFGVSREAQFDCVVALPQRVTILGITREVHING